MAYLSGNFDVIPPASAIGEPTWEIALFHPPQGSWTEEQYLELTTSNWMVELVRGRLEVLPMPSVRHQLIVAFIFKALNEFVAQHAAGHVLFAPMPVHLGKDVFREPEIVYLRRERVTDLRGQPEGADLVMEIVSPGSEARKRDMVVKPRDYAAAGIAEYWIVDPEQRTIQVLALDGDAYREHGLFPESQRATSVLLEGFAVAVSEVFNVV